MSSEHETRRTGAPFEACPIVEQRKPNFKRVEDLRRLWLMAAHSSDEVYREPSREGYRVLLRLARDEVISALLLPEVEIPLSQIWP